MSSTKVQIISNALGLLGKKPIASLASPDGITQSAEQAFDFLLKSKLSTGQWRFAATITQLPQLASPPFPLNPPPPTPQTSNFTYWQYAYQLPGDFLKLIRLYPHNYMFEIYENLLYCQLTNPLYIEYVQNVVPTALPDYFNQYFKYEIAAELALSNAQTAQFYAPLTQKRDYEMAVAMAADAQNRPQTQIQSRPTISNRFVATWVYG